ncbi:hypothetical protein JKP88DRAFT_271193 [Tribonema minus]|uniref:peptidylprolyl isomerase n=1 Tax=Tribonema minus TaxID=303371 RepID=A0A835ZG37_9STRA|nr:hypothetical protein JKP88DRAFT_271193 [Tribonema minus]
MLQTKGAICSILAAAALTLSPLASFALPQKPPESNAQVILLEALPQSQTAAIQALGAELGKMTSEGSGNIRSVDAKGFKGVRSWDTVLKQERAVDGLLGMKEGEILASVGAGNQAQAKKLLEGIRADIAAIDAAAKKESRPAVVEAQVAALSKVDRLGVMMLKGKAPFAVPEDEAPGVPRLYGRGYAEITVKAAKGGRVGIMKATLDGVNAPVSVGNFADLAKRGFYDGTPVSFSDESTVMMGLPAGKAGFEANGAVRRVPLEIRAEGDSDISYEESLEEQGRFKAKPVLPFSAYGTLAYNHPPDNSNGASSQFWALKFDPSYTPAGLNTLDGAYTVFGYVIEGADLLDDLDVGDQIVSVKIVDSLELKP